MKISDRTLERIRRAVERASEPEPDFGPWDRELSNQQVRLRHVIEELQHRRATAVAAALAADGAVATYAADWGRMRRAGLSRADILRNFLAEVAP